MTPRIAYADVVNDDDYYRAFAAMMDGLATGGRQQCKIKWVTTTVGN
jgi:hypothetical protein